MIENRQRNRSFAVFIVVSGLFLPTLSSGGASTGEDGLAAKYACDEGIQADPEVILFTDFDSAGWRDQWPGGQRATVSEVRSDRERGFEPLQGQAMRIKVPQGEHYGASLRYDFEERMGREPEQIYFRYYLRFGSDWNPRRGGKLPGIGGTYGRAGWGGRPSDGRKAGQPAASSRVSEKARPLSVSTVTTRI